MIVETKINENEVSDNANLDNQEINKLTKQAVKEQKLVTKQTSDSSEDNISETTREGKIQKVN